MSEKNISYFSLSVKNTLSGAITFNGASNGISPWPSGSGNPPLIAHYIPAMQTVTNAVLACGGKANGMTSVYYPTTDGKVTFNLPDASLVTFTWNVNEEKSNYVCTPMVGENSSYEVIMSNSEGNFTAIIQIQYR